MSRMWGYKQPSITNPYVYLNSLAVDPYPPSKHMFEIAGNFLKDEASANLNTESENIQNALNFLSNARDFQRAHEFAFIHARIDELKSLGKLGSEEQELCNQLESMMNTNTVNDYMIFLDGLNMVINNLQKYKTRIKAFNTTAVSNIPQVRMVENLATTIGSYADQRYALYYSQEEAIRQLALRWLAEKGSDFVTNAISQGIQGGKNMAAALALITQQMSRYIYDTRQLKERHVSAADKKGKYADFKSPQALADFINKIDLDDFEKYTNMSSILEDNQLLKEIQDMYGIDYDATVVANNRKTSKKGYEDIKELKSLLNSDPLITPQFRDIMNGITVEWAGHNPREFKLSLENELVSALSSAFNGHQHLGRLNMGTDMLLSFDFDKDNGEISQALKRIAYRIKTESATNNVDAISKIYLEEMDKLNDTLNDIKGGFIIHETTKNYNTLEKGKWPTNMDSFSGREMNIFNFLDSIVTFGEIQGFDVNWLRFVAYNLATDAMGSMYKQPLETILSIFAGIIMFDDFAVIGQEAAKEMMNTGKTQAIHLYRLQDMYFPASMFLDATYQKLMGVKDTLLMGNGFTVDINKVPTINYYPEEGNYYKPNLDYGAKFIQRWEGVKAYAYKNTTVHLHFASNFLQLMQSLSAQW